MITGAWLRSLFQTSFEYVKVGQVLSGFAFALQFSPSKVSVTWFGMKERGAAISFIFSSFFFGSLFESILIRGTFHHEVLFAQEWN